MDGLNDTFVDPVNEKETMEFFCEGLLKASSSARELAIVQNHPIWHDVSLLLDEIRNKGVDLSKEKSLGRQKTLQILDIRENIMNKTLGERSPLNQKFFLK